MNIKQELHGCTTLSFNPPRSHWPKNVHKRICRFSIKKVQSLAHDHLSKYVVGEWYTR